MLGTPNEARGCRVAVQQSYHRDEHGNVSGSCLLYPRKSSEDVLTRTFARFIHNLLGWQPSGEAQSAEIGNGLQIISGLFRLGLAEAFAASKSGSDGLEMVLKMANAL